MSLMATKKQTPTGLTEQDVIDWYNWLSRGGLKNRRAMLLQNYELKPEDVWALIKQQKGCCPICGKLLYLAAGAGRGIAIDHEGEPGQGRVRGVLHAYCNRDTLGRLEAAYGDPDCTKAKSIAHGYFVNPPAKNVPSGDSNLFDETIQDRKQRDREGRICQNPKCEEKIPVEAPRNKIYCDKKCRNAVSNAVQAARRQAARPIRTCKRKGCETEIPVEAPRNKIYCDKKCKDAVHEAKRRKCPACGKRFTASHPNRTYCNAGCQNAARNARRKILSAKARQDLECKSCGKQLDASRSDHKYCDNRCRQAFRRANGLKKN